MDILRRELNEIYESQQLHEEALPREAVAAAREIAECLVRVSNGCAVITDAACDRCYVFSGKFGEIMGFASGSPEIFEVGSSDEDIIYDRIHPEDLVDKRLLEYELFKVALQKSAEEKTGSVAKCVIRMMDSTGEYRDVDNTTRILHLSPCGKMWLILCTYEFSASLPSPGGIGPVILDTLSGERHELSFSDKRGRVLTPREKEILALIKEGKPSKQVADILGISVHTVNRHRQNIIEKLSVGNIIEAITAANLMRLL